MQNKSGREDGVRMSVSDVRSEFGSENQALWRSEATLFQADGTNRSCPECFKDCRKIRVSGGERGEDNVSEQGRACSLGLILKATGVSGRSLCDGRALSSDRLISIRGGSLRLPRGVAVCPWAGGQREGVAAGRPGGDCCSDPGKKWSRAVKVTDFLQAVCYCGRVKTWRSNSASWRRPHCRAWVPSVAFIQHLSDQPASAALRARSPRLSKVRSSNCFGP